MSPYGYITAGSMVYIDPYSYAIRSILWHVNGYIFSFSDTEPLPKVVSKCMERATLNMVMHTPCAISESDFTA